MAVTFGAHLIQFIRALDLIDDRRFGEIIRLIDNYVARTLEIDSSRLLVASVVHKVVRGRKIQKQALIPFRLAKEGDFRSTPLENARKQLSSQAAFAFEKDKRLWVVSASSKCDLLRNATSFRDRWSGEKDLPPFFDVTNKDIRTSILIPLKYSNRRVFGVATFETHERLDITEAAKRELDLIAQSLSIVYRLLRDGQSRFHRTDQGLDALEAYLAEPQVKLTKPHIFLASSERGKADVVDAIQRVIDDREFREIFKMVYWKEMNKPGSINRQLLDELSRCRYGVCYMSEESEGESPLFKDNINVVFEAGMLHGRSDVASPVPASWIPIREEDSAATPFDFASQRMIIVPRHEDGSLDEESFTKQFRKQLKGLTKDDALP